MERLFSKEMNPNLDMAEFDAMLAEFKQDYNQRHFVRNETFKAAADKIQGPARKIFIEFLERSCTAEFSGFLLYKVCSPTQHWLACQDLFGYQTRKSSPPIGHVCLILGVAHVHRVAQELGRRLKATNPAVAEIFTLMSRDEARHAGFLNKAMSDFNLALDLGFLTKNRKYTFFKPKFIL
jgi:magnesium-protoporphyrin IX monomethyl ester (oxidative) cyclase